MSFNVYVGLRGSGKSSLAVKFARKALKKGKKVFSNFPIDGCYLYDVSDLGTFDISNCVLIFDEAGIDLNNRAYKTMPKECISFWKLTRHYGISDIYIFSQAQDYDITLRRLADHLFVIKRLFFDLSIIKPLHSYWDTDEDGQPIVKYKFGVLPSIFYRKPYYKYFDSYSCPRLAHKDFNFVKYIDEPADGIARRFHSLKSFHIFARSRARRASLCKDVVPESTVAE